jgi:hypothetical protein
MEFFLFALNRNMKTFGSFLSTKTLDRLAEKCVKGNLPIVEFAQWYEEEGQFLAEGWMGNVGAGGLAGAGIGSLAGPWGTLAGAGIGAGIGGIKSLYDRYAQKRVGVGADSRFASDTKDLTPQPPQSPQPTHPYAKQQAAMRQHLQQAQPAKLMARFQDAAKQDSLMQSLGGSVMANLAHNGISPERFNKAFQANQAELGDETQAVIRTLNDFGIRNRAGAPFQWNPKGLKYEAAINALNKIAKISPNIKLEDVVDFLSR